MNFVLLPGFMLDYALWDDMAEALGGVGTLHFGDLRFGHTIAEMAEQVLATAPARFVLIGFSMGGYVAREMVRMAPNRVSALVLVGTSSRADKPERAERKAEAVKRVGDGVFRGISRGAAAAALHPDRAGDTVMIERIRAMGIRMGGEAFVRQLQIKRASDTDRLGEIHCRTLVIAAAQDGLRSLAEPAELRDGIPGATMQVIEGSGHMMPLETPQQLTQIILDWLG
ncbi:alpha/beta fold hydrolase [Acidisphaera sp. L21]|uniref:alpha/beta fold hydrolase n=1 Tax=Acidisphaera sp. L21 TaxID=1641851 RepID=UPI00131B703D|nr:alpha/beta fold hydrolase [Acidisphaera sp. L21]